VAGPLGSLFGLCANEVAVDDGKVVSFDHGCGAHSESLTEVASRPQGLPEPFLDTVSFDDFESF